MTLFKFRKCLQYVSAKAKMTNFEALMAFSDGRYVGAILDRNGLRPARYYITNDDRIFLASEVGVVDLPEEIIVKKVSIILIS